MWQTGICREEKNMKRTTILVLLVVMAGVVSTLGGPQTALAGEVPEYTYEVPDDGKIRGGVHELSGQSDDGGVPPDEGDPDDLGGGHGVFDRPDFLAGDSIDGIEAIWEDLMIFLMIHLQLLP
jgi:hypothetical protein